MADCMLYRLHLSSPLTWLRVAPDEAARAVPPSEEGSEILLAFDPAGFQNDDPDEGPRLAFPLPLPAAAGLRHSLSASGKSGQPADAPKPAPGEIFADRKLDLPSGEYLFMQWRPGKGDTVERAIHGGMEDFLRELWWEGQKTEGPWYFRALREDGKTAFQALRALSPNQPAE
ncbi:MAG: hypothetical protein WAZ31_02335 [Rectinemataceae bacterium]